MSSGFIAAMVSSLKNNRKMRRDRSYYSKDKKLYLQNHQDKQYREIPLDKGASEKTLRGIRRHFRHFYQVKLYRDAILIVLATILTLFIFLLIDAYIMDFWYWGKGK